MSATITHLIDCHAHDFDGTDGYLDLVGIAETYGVMIRECREDDAAVPAGWGGWATWYEVTAPLENMLRFLTEEYAGGEYEAREMLGLTTEN